MKTSHVTLSEITGLVYKPHPWFLTQNLSKKVWLIHTNTYQMSDPIKCMVAEWPSQDSFSTENDQSWDFQSLNQIQIMLKVFRQCQGSKCKSGSNWKAKNKRDAG